MAEPIIRIEGAEALIAKIDTLKQLREFGGTMKAAGAHVAGKMIEAYNSASNQHRPQPFKSEKQRRGFFYHLRKGDIEVPYRRGQSPGSRNLKQHWSVKLENAGTTAIVENSTPYGSLVQSRDNQTKYHKETGWITDMDVVESEADAVKAYVLYYFERTLEK